MNSGRAYTIGENVLARYRDGEWYPAEVVSVVPTGYVVEWFDGSGRGRMPPDKVRDLPALNAPHRFGIGQRVVSDFDSYWAAGTVAGVFEHGYLVHFDDGEHMKLVEAEAFLLATGELPPVGGRVLGWFEEDGYWYPARLAAQMAGSVELRWEDGNDRVTLKPDHVMRFPASAEPAPPEQEQGQLQEQGQPPTQSSATADVLEHYLTRRLEAGELIMDDRTEPQYCPACKQVHQVAIVEDDANGTQFWVCNASGEPVVVMTEGASRSLATSPVEAFVTRYPALARRKVSFLARLFASAEVEVSPLPPFISLRVGKRSE